MVDDVYIYGLKEFIGLLGFFETTITSKLSQLLHLPAGTLSRAKGPRGYHVPESVWGWVCRT